MSDYTDRIEEAHNLAECIQEYAVTLPRGDARAILEYGVAVLLSVGVEYEDEDDGEEFCDDYPDCACGDFEDEDVGA